MTSKLPLGDRVGLALMAMSGALLLGLIPTSYSQQSVDLPLPFLEFRCPPYPVAAKRTMSLQAEIEGAREALGEEGANRISYSWSASGARIISGQTARAVTIELGRVSARERVLNVDVTVRISGLPAVVENERTCSIKINPKCKPPQLFSRYKDLPLWEEKLTLDRLAKHLMSSGLGSAAYLVVYSGKFACTGEAEWRANRAQKYLVATYEIDPNRIVAVDGGFRDRFTVEIFTSPVDLCGPFPTPSRLPSSAHISGFCEDKYASENK